MNLEDKIRENRYLFDDSEPMPGHAERFGKRLHPSGGKARVISLWLTVSSIAAAVVWILVFRHPDTSSWNCFDQDPVTEVACYYNRQLTEEAAKLKEELKGLDRESRKQISEDIDGILDLAGKKDPDYDRMTDEERIVFITYSYQAYQESLHRIESVLENTNQIHHISN